MVVNIGFLCLIFAVGISAVSYSGMSQSYGWPIGEVLAGSRWSTTLIVADLACICALIRAVQIYAWWTSVIVLVGGFLLGLVMTMRLRKAVQIPAVVGSWIGLFALPVLPVLPF